KCLNIPREYIHRSSGIIFSVVQQNLIVGPDGNSIDDEIRVPAIVVIEINRQIVHPKSAVADFEGGNQLWFDILYIGLLEQSQIIRHSLRRGCATAHCLAKGGSKRSNRRSGVGIFIDVQPFTVAGNSSQDDDRPYVQENILVSGGRISKSPLERSAEAVFF